ncbi:MAG TPA: hypothetical protein P5121_17350 [Caldilineaceae bacterium]|nr:hypothetical protein [Caldilineaceae bacterium]
MNQMISSVRTFTVAAALTLFLVAATGSVGNGQHLSLDAAPAVMGSPQALAGFRGQGDQRDADLYPTVAFDAVNQRYLAVWQSVRNANSRSDGFDLYGIFLSQHGTPIGSPFRISDRNDVARSSPPTVVAANGSFVVAWTRRGSPCRLSVQQVFNSAARADLLIETNETAHQHSPSLVYHPTTNRYVVAYVAGDDYLPMKLFGTSSADCGDSAGSSSTVNLLTFHFADGLPVTDEELTVSTGSGAALRPALAYNGALRHFFVAWEDRRNAAGDQWHFDVYGQSVSQALKRVGNNFQLDSGGRYLNHDDSATWTPRPSVAAGNKRFLASWYHKEAATDAELWSLQSALVVTDTVAVPVFTVADMTFVDPPDGNAPTGFAQSLYHPRANEYLVVLSSHTQSLFGYFSSVRVQRLTANGTLLKTDGSIQSTPGAGYVVDTALDDQLSIGAAVNPVVGTDTGYLIIYGRHAPGQHSQDFDIWRAQMLQNHLPPVLYLPTVFNKKPPLID